MKPSTSVEELLRWRLSQAEAGAPPPPRASRLLALVRPWWETWPERFDDLAARVGAIRMSHGHAMTTPPPNGERPVAALIVRSEVAVETTALILYFSVREGRLRMRFQLDTVLDTGDAVLEATFVSHPDGGALFATSATLAVDSEFRLDTAIPAELEVAWAMLKVTDRMPFRLILRAVSPSG